MTRVIRIHLFVEPALDAGGYYEAQATAWDFQASIKGELGPPLGRTRVCTSRDEKRAISFALTELAVLLERSERCDKPPPEGYYPCTREQGHEGPCALPIRFAEGSM